jgi:hypothetical protein
MRKMYSISTCVALQMWKTIIIIHFVCRNERRTLCEELSLPRLYRISLLYVNTKSENVIN